MMEVKDRKNPSRHVSKDYTCTSGLPDKLYLVAGDDKDVVVRTTHDEDGDVHRVVTVILPPTDARALALDLLQSADLADKYRKGNDD